MNTNRSRLVAVLVCAALVTGVSMAEAQRRNRRASTASRAASIPAGTPIDIRLMTKLETGEVNDGDTFQGTVAAPVVASGQTVLAKDTRVSGRVVKAVSSGRLKRPAELTLQLTSPVASEPVTIDGKSHGKRNAAMIGGGAAAGALIGAVAGGGKGAAIGAAVGAGAGTATAYMTGKQELVLPVEMPIRFVAAGGQSAAGQVLAPAPAIAPAGEDRNPPPHIAASRRGAPGSSPAGISSYASSFSESDRGLIRNWLANNRANLPPGLAKRDSLPPGLERQVRRNGKLPPGLQKRLQPFPADLEGQLPRLPAGYTRQFLGHRALLLNASRVIVDMFLAQ